MGRKPGPFLWSIATVLIGSFAVPLASWALWSGNDPRYGHLLPLSLAQAGLVLASTAANAVPLWLTARGALSRARTNIAYAAGLLACGLVGVVTWPSVLVTLASTAAFPGIVLGCLVIAQIAARSEIRDTSQAGTTA